MTDAPRHDKPLDPGRIDTIDTVEIENWSRQLHCTEQELMQAMAQVGNHVSAVRDYLASRPH